MRTALTGAAMTSVLPSPASAQLTIAPPLSEPSASLSASTLPSGASDAQDAAKLPVSLDRIRRGLERPAEPLRDADQRPYFRSGVSEKQTFRQDDLISHLDFSSGPAIAGGQYGYEVSQQAFPPVDNPLRQSYAAFNQPELLTIAIENVAAQYVGSRAFAAIAQGERARAEQTAREEVQRTLAAMNDGGPSSKSKH
jgi:hypothetical protein